MSNALVESKANAGKSLRFFLASPRTPVHPGRFLETRYLQPGHISQDALATALGISRRRVNELVCGKRVITPDTAVHLARHCSKAQSSCSYSHHTETAQIRCQHDRPLQNPA